MPNWKQRGSLRKLAPRRILPPQTASRQKKSEQRKIIDAETQIRDADQAITDLEEKIAKQETLLKNLEDRLRWIASERYANKKHRIYGISCAFLSSAG